MSGNDWLLHELPPANYKHEHPLRELFADAIDLLDEEDRLAIEAIYWEGITLAELAVRLGLGAKQSAHHRKKRAVANLKEKLAVLGFPEDKIIEGLDTT